ncbi:MAG: hypothetical protein M3Q07_04580 [Pseudobdellovibrionaceae bacterium]|nr:hypothetical protein [Pseudobdellovibrionaceae bacterium]
MADFANGMARDLNQPLRSLERFANDMRAITGSGQLADAMPRIQSAHRAVLDISQSTQRYRLIASGPGIEDDQPISVRELIDFVLLFPSCQGHLSRSRTLTSGCDQAQTLPHAVGRLVILVLCSTLNRIEGPLQGRLHALGFDVQHATWMFTLVFFVHDHQRLQLDIQELLADLKGTLQSARGSFMLQLPDGGQGPATLILRLPQDF